jgi:hypothetical protein
MFNETTESVQLFLDQSIERVNNLEDILTKRVGVSSQVAVNTLYQLSRKTSSVHSDRSPFLLSQYVCRKVVARLGDAAANMMWNWAVTMDHSPVKGWAYEAKCISAWITSTMTLQLTHLDTFSMVPNTHPKKSNEQLQDRSIKSRGTEYVALKLTAKGSIVEQHPEKSKNLSGEDSIVTIPEKWNQACFDFVIKEGKELFFLQCTLRAKHNRIIRHISDVLDECQKMSISFDSVHLVAITPKDEFQFSDPGMSASGINKISFWWAKYTV